MPKINCSIDKSGLHKMIGALNKLEKREVSAGFDGEMHGDDKITMAELAIIHDRGVKGKIPPRPFMKQAALLVSDEIGKEAASVVTNTLKNNPSLVQRDLVKVGTKGAEAIQEAIDRGQFRKLSPTTIRIKKAKNSLYPEDILIDSSELYQSAGYHIK